jgi:acetylglutamate kinase
VKLGGNAVGSLVAELAAGAGRLVVVHGGGAQISELMRRRGIEPRFVGGRRVTDLPTLACVRTALANVSDALVVAAGGAGHVAEGLRRGEVVVARRVAALGLVGEVASVDVAPIAAVLERGAIPLLAPIGRDHGDRYLNVNADDVAAAVAVALGADELVFLSDVEGVLDPGGNVLAAISASAPPPVTGGMVPKLAACAVALAGGVRDVRVGTGTRVTA